MRSKVPEKCSGNHKGFPSVLKEVPNMIPPAKGRTVQGFYILYYVNYIQIIIIMF